MVEFAIYKSQFGFLKIAHENGIIVLLEKIHMDAVEDFGTKTEFTDEVFAQLVEYFQGKRKSFSFPYELRGTPFQKKVWNALCQIPYGETRSYKEIAIAVGNEKASRAVGMANNKNPITIAVPCHRVVGSRGKLVGYAGGIEMKKYLLEMEAEHSISGTFTDVTDLEHVEPVEVLRNRDFFVTKVPYDVKEGFLDIHLKLEECNKDSFILLPSCCYKGNQFETKLMKYPPMYEPEEARVDMPILITNVPRLNTDGSGCISVSVGDLATPCIGIFQQDRKKAYFLFINQQYKGMNYGLSYKMGELTIHTPANRRNNHPHTSIADGGMEFKKGEEVKLPYKWFEFHCDSIVEFYECYFRNRKCMNLPMEKSKTLTLEQAWQIHEEKFNAYNFNEDIKAYTVGCEYDNDSFWGRYQIWQPGWTGGAMSSYPLMKLGSALSYQRGMDTLKFLFSTQQKSGFFVGVVDGKGKYYGDGFAVEHTSDWHMVRKSADILYFMFKHFEVIKEHGDVIPSYMLEGTKRLADGFARIWNTYGQLGQFISHSTGKIIVGGSTAGALVSAGLVKAAEWFGISDYIEIAEAIGRKYYEDYTCRGYTVGGPGEILQCPDSESAFLLLESFVTLYKTTKKAFWLQAAKDQVAQCSSWVVSYNYEFPITSEFGRLGIKTVGSVFANVQNKHSAPGICTLSGDSIHELYKITGDKAYLELIEDIATNIFQYMSTEDRPIFSRSNPDKPCPSGYINERVNTSDWEGKQNVGTIFYGSTWAETSSMLTIAELANLF